MLMGVGLGEWAADSDLQLHEVKSLLTNFKPNGATDARLSYLIL